MAGDDRSTNEGRHPLPASDEARRDELPETLVSEKGTGDDSVEQVQPAEQPVAPDGETYDVGIERRAGDGRPDAR